MEAWGGRVGLKISPLKSVFPTVYRRLEALECLIDTATMRRYPEIQFVHNNLSKNGSFVQNLDRTRCLLI